LWAVGAPEDYGVCRPINDFGVFEAQGENASQEFEENEEFATQWAPLYNEEQEVVLKCMGTTQGISCRGHTSIAHI
jgi:hypothetical protein